MPQTYQGKKVTLVRDAHPADPYFRKPDPGLGDQVIITMEDGSEQVVPRHAVIDEPDAPHPEARAPVGPGGAEQRQAEGPTTEKQLASRAKHR